MGVGDNLWYIVSLTFINWWDTTGAKYVKSHPIILTKLQIQKLEVFLAVTISLSLSILKKVQAVHKHTQPWPIYTRTVDVGNNDGPWRGLRTFLILFAFHCLT